jgi:uncharacterized surface protein with fasciclin (FAS1) repeats
MKKIILCVSLVCSLFLFSCVDKNEEVDEDAKPTWLGNSIYDELKNPKQDILTGTFNTYLRLVDDLGYSNVLSQTGSKTVFPANDEAFDKFFKNNNWGVSRYEDLSGAQKKMLLYSSMLDNAILVSMLSNVSSGSTTVMKGMAMKHATTQNVIDSIPFYLTPTVTFQNNPYWTSYDKTGIYAVSDNTKPMMIHFTREQMLANSITTLGDNSDFSIITGSPYTEGSAYIFRDKIINSDVTCQNGYIHQVQDVLTPPGNLAQVIREGGETKLFSRMLDRFCIPFYDATTTNNYNDWAIQHNAPLHDSIYQIRYLSSVSQDQKAMNYDTHSNSISSELLLPFDPGWNGYYVQNLILGAVDWTLADVGAMFVPEDEAIKKYFLPGGTGEFLMDQYGVKPNTLENLEENIDAIPQNIIQKFLANLMKVSFIASVPSKFESMTNDVSDEMGMSVGLLKKSTDGTYDVKIANNGVIYVLNDVIAPTEYEAVSAPAYFSNLMKVINWVIQNKAKNGSTSNKYSIDLDFYAYLKAMSANFAVFLPDDKAFDQYYVDPATLGNKQPVALHFYYSNLSDARLCCSKWAYDPVTNQVGDSLAEVNDITTMASQLTDIMNYHTVVLKAGERIGTNKYYKTKQGGEIKVSGGSVGASVESGGQINNGLAPSKIETVYNEKNGVSYRINHLIQGPQQSVYKVLNENENFSEFLKLCQGFDNEQIMEWVGISSQADETTGISPQDLYRVFVNNGNKCLDYNVRFFNTYNYTLYAPDNDAMQVAYDHNLPTWEAVYNLYANYANKGNDEETQAQAQAYAMINEIKSFIRYHFQNTSVYADNVVPSASYQTLLSDDHGIYQSVSISGGNGVLKVTDLSGTSHTIDSSSPGLMSNEMTRDFLFDNVKESATKVVTSSFAVIHELDEPLYYNKSKSYNSSLSTAKGMARLVKKYLALKASNKL